jgi:hypothetical protein
MATQAHIADRGLLKVETYVEGVLDNLEIAERAYHHLIFGSPLVADLVSRARRYAEAGDRVLVIGGSTLLIESLAGLGFDLDVWQLPGTYLTERAQQYVSRTVTPDSLLQQAPQDGYRLIVLPLVLEAFGEAEAQALMRRLREMLSHDGCALIGTENQSRLESRLAAIAGRPLARRRKGDELSLGWPSVKTAHTYHRDELIELSRASGLATRRCEAVSAQRPFMEMELLNVFAYGGRKAAEFVKRIAPPTRDVIVLECSRRVADHVEVKTAGDQPNVSVIVSALLGGARLAATLDSLLRQTYPADHYEIVVLDDGRAAAVADIVDEFASRAASRVRRLVVVDHGPQSRNLAMIEGGSDITAHTDDTAVVPKDWIEGALAWFDEDTAVVSGPVFASEGSGIRSLEVAATRPDPDEKAPPSDLMFPISNVFYRTAVAIAAGGFDQAFQRNSGAPALGWDAELAWRLRRLGWKTRYQEEVFQHRFFPPEMATGPGWAARQFRQTYELPQLMAGIPEYAGRTLISNTFASRQTMYFDLAVVGGVVAALLRRRAPLVLFLPWLSSISARIDLWPVRNWMTSARTVASIALRQAVWLAGLIAGSVKARRIVL